MIHIPTELVFPGADELVGRLESFRVADPIINCNVSVENIKEVNLALSEVYKTHTTPRTYGAVDDVEAAIAAEKEALNKMAKGK